MTEIRRLAAADETAWRHLWAGYLAFYRTDVPEAVRAATFARLTDANDPAQEGLLATRDGEPLGLAHLIYHRHGWQMEDICYLQDLYVAPEARGQGLGRALIAAVYAAADANGTPSVYWLTEETNRRARKLYDRVGTPTGFIKYRR
jgi:GNAT superfamily N-acetyltransferase